MARFFFSMDFVAGAVTDAKLKNIEAADLPATVALTDVDNNFAVGQTVNGTLSIPPTGGPNFVSFGDAGGDLTFQIQADGMIVSAGGATFDGDVSFGAGLSANNATFSTVAVGTSYTVLGGSNTVLDAFHLGVDQVVITAGTNARAPLKLAAGTNLATPQNGAFEYDGTSLYFTTGGTRKTVSLV